ncbi:hypothetical protein TNCV_4291781 [Trichonephila clavipes]|uniref:Uncharacterized protein n=1 Tax=Trichonephila clavipes TaxID=2585209 RepID=A0A8X6RK62_TRICX|nr:hypothetical protein TNCV_4291781 [Trichonephila clavipes]
MDLAILNHGHVTRTTPELVLPLLTTTPKRGLEATLLHGGEGCGSPVVKVSDHGSHVMNSSPVPLKTRRVGKGCVLNLSRAQTSYRWCDS